MKIKHRLIDANNKIVGYEKWYAGSFDKERQIYNADPTWLYSKDGEFWTPNKIEHRYKNRFIGLTDKNGKEIYEEDILQQFTYNNEPLGRYFIDSKLYKSCGCCSAIYGWDIENPYEEEIIGNTYEHNHLLEPAE